MATHHSRRIITGSCLLLLLLFFFTTVLTLKPCTDHSLRPCTCDYTLYEHVKRYVVNCTDTNFRTANMLKNLPPETEVLIFTGNNIPELPWNVFGEFNSFPNLSMIDMSNNGIREIKGKSYHHVTNVRRLILNHNNLTISDSDLQSDRDRDHHYHHPRVFSNFVNLLELHLTDAFADNTDTALANDLHDIFVNSNLTFLNKLHLEQNEIKGFRDPNVFCDLPKLMDLHLGDNYITGLTFNIVCLTQLRFLDLERNNITKLTRGELSKLDSLTYPVRNRKFIVDLNLNPFSCESDDVRNLFLWSRDTNVTIRNKESLMCFRNHGRGAVKLRQLFEGGDRDGDRNRDRDRDRDQDQSSSAPKAITLLLVILAVVLVSLLIALAYLSREQIVDKCRPFYDAISRKVQYTTIESQDV